MNNIVASSLLNNIVETMLNNIVGPAMLLTHDNNVAHVTKHCSGNITTVPQCNNLAARLFT